MFVRAVICLCMSVYACICLHIVYTYSVNGYICSNFYMVSVRVETSSCAHCCGAGVFANSLCKTFNTFTF